MVRGKPITRFARRMDLSPPLDILIFVANTHRHVGIRSVQRTGVQSYSHAVEVRPAHDMRIVLRLLVVALIHNPEYDGNGCSES
jgi:hypothetical protein